MNPSEFKQKIFEAFELTGNTGALTKHLDEISFHIVSLEERTKLAKEEQERLLQDNNVVRESNMLLFLQQGHNDTKNAQMEHEEEPIIDLMEVYE